MDHEYAYDVTLSTVVRVAAPTPAIAEHRLREVLSTIEISGAEATLESSLLIAIDGEEVE